MCGYWLSRSTENVRMDGYVNSLLGRFSVWCRCTEFIFNQTLDKCVASLVIICAVFCPFFFLTSSNQWIIPMSTPNVRLISNIICYSYTIDIPLLITNDIRNIFNIKINNAINATAPMIQSIRLVLDVVAYHVRFFFHFHLDLIQSKSTYELYHFRGW